MEPTPTQSDPGIGVVSKLAALLDCLAREGELSVAELSRILGGPRTSMYRLVHSLMAVGMIEPGSRRGSYRLGLGLFRLGSTVLSRLDVRQAALPIMERVRTASEQTVFLCVRRGYEAVCIERLDGLGVQSMALKLGGVLPLHAGAAPRALLAFETDEFIAKYLDDLDETAQLTPKSLNSRVTLMRELEKTRERGYSLSDEDVVLSMAALGAPVRNHLGEVCAALSLSGLRSSVLDDREHATVELITTGAANISAALGYTELQPPVAQLSTT